jgi:hypothetical protein
MTLLPGLDGTLVARSNSSEPDRANGVERTGTTGVGIYDFNFVRELIADALITTPGNYLMVGDYPRPFFVSSLAPGVQVLGLGFRAEDVVTLVRISSHR